MNKTIEAEGSELVLRNKKGDYVIIPKKYRQEVQDMIAENCHSCIDSLVETLPVASEYAKDGSVILNPDDKKPKVKVKIENPNINKTFNEDELYYWINQDIPKASDNLRNQAKYTYYSKLLEEAEFKDNEDYIKFKKELPAKLVDRFAKADSLAKTETGKKLTIKDEKIKTHLKDKANDYFKVKTELEKLRKTNTEGTDIESNAHGARSIAMGIDPILNVLHRSSDTNDNTNPENKTNLGRNFKYKVVYNPEEDNYEYVLLDAEKGSDYTLIKK